MLLASSLSCNFNLPSSTLIAFGHLALRHVYVTPLFGLIFVPYL